MAADGSVLRTRDEEKLGKCDVLVDVGGVYDPENNRFDHHQREFNEKFPMKCSNGEEPCTKMSSAGLVYKHFGRQILRERYGITNDDELEKIYYRVYEAFILAVDADDNGVGSVDGGKRRYREIGSLPSRIAALYPDWNVSDADATRLAVEEMKLAVALYKKEEESANAYRCLLPKGEVAPFSWLAVPINSEVEADSWRFRKAMKIADEAFAQVVTSARDSWLKSFSVVKDAMQNRTLTQQSKEVLELPYYCPFRGTVYELEREAKEEGEVLFALYPAKRGSVMTWVVRCVEKEGSEFEPRLPLAENLRGLRDLALGEAVLKNARISLQPTDFVFCHATGFMAIAKCKEGAMEIIRQTLESRTS